MDYIWRVTDNNGDKAELTFKITVSANAVPSFAITIANRSFTQNAQIMELVFPNASGGDGTLEYELVGTLPAGLVLDFSDEQGSEDQ